MSIEAIIICFAFSDNALNAILCISVALFGLSMTLFTLSVAFIVSGKTTNSEITNKIKKNGISITDRSKLIKNRTATTLMSNIARRSLYWFCLNLIFTVLLLLYILFDTTLYRVTTSWVSVVYLVCTVFYAINVLKTLYTWYKNHIK